MLDRKEDWRFLEFVDIALLIAFVLLEFAWNFFPWYSVVLYGLTLSALALCESCIRDLEREKNGKE